VKVNDVYWLSLIFNDCCAIVDFTKIITISAQFIKKYLKVLTMRRFRKINLVQMASVLFTGLLTSQTWAADKVKLPSLDDLAGTNQPMLLFF